MKKFIRTDIDIDETDEAPAQTQTDATSTSLRPSDFDGYVGQEDARKVIVMAIHAARERREPLDHILLHGPPGLGKTTLAGIIASEMGCRMRTVAGPSIGHSGEMAAVLNSLGEKDVLFIDEIHRLDRTVEETLYQAMEDRCIDIIMGKGAEARSIRLNLPEFTLIGATTREGMLSPPFRDRFGISLKMQYYNVEELSEIVKRSARKLCIGMTDEGAAAIAKASRGTPRIANRLLKRARDAAQSAGMSQVTEELVMDVFALLGIDPSGLGRTDMDILGVLHEAGGTAGLSTIASALGEDPGTIEEVYEPFLLKNGLIRKTPKGRVMTEKAAGRLRSVRSKG